MFVFFFYDIPLLSCFSTWSILFITTEGEKTSDPTPPLKKNLLPTGVPREPPPHLPPPPTSSPFPPAPPRDWGKPEALTKAELLSAQSAQVTARRADPSSDAKARTLAGEPCSSQPGVAELSPPPPRRPPGTRLEACLGGQRGPWAPTAVPRAPLARGANRLCCQRDGASSQGEAKPPRRKRQCRRPSPAGAAESRLGRPQPARPLPGSRSARGAAARRGQGGLRPEAGARRSRASVRRPRPASPAGVRPACPPRGLSGLF